MPKASDIQLDSYASFLFKGPFGFAKTCAAASFAIEGPIFLAYWDKKKPLELQHFFHKIVKRPDLLNRIEYEVYGSHNANQYLNKCMQLAKDCPYTAFITDSVTTLTAGAVNWSLSFREDRKNKEKLKVLPDWDEYKVETSLVTQALDICRTLPCHIIWTAHPIPGVKLEGSGSSIKVTKVNPIVSYGSKVAGIVPGEFSEIYHFSQESTWDASGGGSAKKYMVHTSAVGDEFAKSNIGLSEDIDITNRLFYEVWKEKLKSFKEALRDEVNQINAANVNDPLKDKISNPW
jgi:hypothetical protein